MILIYLEMLIDNFAWVAYGAVASKWDRKCKLCAYAGQEQKAKSWIERAVCVPAHYSQIPKTTQTFSLVTFHMEFM